MGLINSVTVRRFKSITDLTISLGRVTVLVGTNNAGKSSVLQGIQFGVSAVQSLALASTKRLKRAETGTLAADQLVYTPLRDVQTLAQGGRLGQGVPAQIEIEFDTNVGNAAIGVRRGKNKNLSVSLAGDDDIIVQLENMATPFSAIAPGLAGVPPVEEFRSPGVVRRAAAYGDANSVFRNVLWILRNDPAAWHSFQSRMRQIFPDVQVDLSFDSENDAYISATVTRLGSSLPIDASGTGILQAAQILSYIGVYRPKILILDEPDSHLHPSNQRQLIRLLDEVASEDNFQVLLSTHSRHMLDECIDLGSTIHWMDNGELRDDSARRLPVLLSLGALDVGDRLKDGSVSTVVLTEDEQTRYIRTLLSANGHDLSTVSVWSYGGCTQLNAAKVLAGFLDDIAPGCDLIIHRDRDFLSVDQVAALRDSYTKQGFSLFVTAGTDIESHFLDIDHLRNVYSERSAAEIADVLERATLAAQDDSIRIMTSERFREAEQKWVRGDRRPQAGDVAAATKVEYLTDPKRFRHGKKTLKHFNRIANAEWKSAKDVVVVSNALEDAALAK